MINTLLPYGLLAAGALASDPAAWSGDDDQPLPLVIWHGLGDSFDGEGIQAVGDLARELFPGIYVHTVRIGADGNADRSATFFGNVSDQVASLCDALAADPIISTAPAVDAIGFSQGGQFLRGYVERCNSPPVRSLVTFGSQHNGIVRFKACADGDYLCKGAMALLRFNTWSGFVQSRLIPAQYYRDPEPEQYEHYLDSSAFLADINNERVLKNTKYADRIADLVNFVMVMFEDDTTVIPKETSWFAEVNGTDSIPLRERDLYQEDWLGLRRLDKAGGLRFRKIPGDHMQFDDETIEAYMKEFFGPAGRTFKPEADQESFLPEEL